MRRMLWLPLLVCLILPVPASGAPERTERACTLNNGYPDLEFDYSPLVMRTTLTFDLERCGDDSPYFEFFGGWLRDGDTGTGDIDGWVSWTCSGLPKCEVEISTDHLPAEKASYRFELFFPPPKGEGAASNTFRRLAFAKDCESGALGAECTDSAEEPTGSTFVPSEQVRSLQEGAAARRRLHVSSDGGDWGLEVSELAGSSATARSFDRTGRLALKDTRKDRRRERPRGKPKPYESEEGTIQGTTVGDGVTNTEFKTTCDPDPHSQGLDGYLFEIPSDYRGRMDAMLEWTGRSDSPLGYELFPYIYNEDCTRGAYYWGSPLEEEEGGLPPWARYVVVESRLPLPVGVKIRLRPMTAFERKLWLPLNAADALYSDPRCNIDRGYPDVDWEYTNSELNISLTFQLGRCWQRKDAFYAFSSYYRATPPIDSPDDAWDIANYDDCPRGTRTCTIKLTKKHPEAETASYYVRFIYPMWKLLPGGREAHTGLIFQLDCESSPAGPKCVQELP